MFEYYCPTCNRKVHWNEIEILEHMYEGDWEDFHIECGSMVDSIPTLHLKED